MSEREARAAVLRRLAQLSAPVARDVQVEAQARAWGEHMAAVEAENLQLREQVAANDRAWMADQHRICDLLLVVDKLRARVVELEGGARFLRAVKP